MANRTAIEQEVLINQIIAGISQAVNAHGTDVLVVDEAPVEGAKLTGHGGDSLSVQRCFDLRSGCPRLAASVRCGGAWRGKVEHCHRPIMTREEKVFRGPGGMDVKRGTRSQIQH